MLPFWHFSSFVLYLFCRQLPWMVVLLTDGKIQVSFKLPRSYFAFFIGFDSTKRHFDAISEVVLVISKMNDVFVSLFALLVVKMNWLFGIFLELECDDDFAFTFLVRSISSNKLAKNTYLFYIFSDSGIEFTNYKWLCGNQPWSTL